MNDEILTARLTALEERVNATYESAEKTRRYILIMVWTAAALTLLPMIGLMFVIPMFLNTLSTITAL